MFLPLTPIICNLTAACVRFAVDRACFQEGSDVFGEVFHTFSSIPHVAKAVQRVVTSLINPTTGQSYSSSSEGQADVPEVDAGSKETPRAHVCGECFNCKVRAQPPPHTYALPTTQRCCACSHLRFRSLGPSSCWLEPYTAVPWTVKSIPVA